MKDIEAYDSFIPGLTWREFGSLREYRECCQSARNRGNPQRKITSSHHRTVLLNKQVSQAILRARLASPLSRRSERSFLFTLLNTLRAIVQNRNGRALPAVPRGGLRCKRAAIRPSDAARGRTGGRRRAYARRPQASPKPANFGRPTSTARGAAAVAAGPEGRSEVTCVCVSRALCALHP